MNDLNVLKALQSYIAKGREAAEGGEDNAAAYLECAEMLLQKLIDEREPKPEEMELALPLEEIR